MYSTNNHYISLCLSTAFVTLRCCENSYNIEEMKFENKLVFNYKNVLSPFKDVPASLIYHDFKLLLRSEYIVNYIIIFFYLDKVTVNSRVLHLVLYRTYTVIP